MLPRPRVIFYAENNRHLLALVRDVLEFAGWYVKECTDPVYIRPIMEVTHEHFDLLLLDNEWRNFKGLEMIKDIRRIPHRKKADHSPLARRLNRRSARGWRGCVLAQAEQFDRVGGHDSSSAPRASQRIRLRVYCKPTISHLTL
jgi:CheY-like chemotaxis protein